MTRDPWDRASVPAEVLQTARAAPRAPCTGVLLPVCPRSGERDTHVTGSSVSEFAQETSVESEKKYVPSTKHKGQTCAHTFPKGVPTRCFKHPQTPSQLSRVTGRVASRLFVRGRRLLGEV